MAHPTDREDLFGLPLPGRGLALVMAAAVLGFGYLPVVLVEGLTASRPSSQSFLRRLESQHLQSQRTAAALADWLGERRSRLPHPAGEVEMSLIEVLEALGTDGRPRTRPSEFDGFGRPFRLIWTGPDTFEIVSRGADGRPGGTGPAADVRVAR